MENLKQFGYTMSQQIWLNRTASLFKILIPNPAKKGKESRHLTSTATGPMLLTFFWEGGVWGKRQAALNATNIAINLLDQVL